MVLQAMELKGLTGHEAGRLLLLKMYNTYTGKVLPPILVTERGKPYFAWGDMHFSISHTKNYVFCALSESPVGIDAEETDRQVDPRLAEKILSPMEKAQYDRAADKNEALLRFWVLKEAAAKLTGEGLRGYPNHTEFDLSDSRIRQMHNCFVAVMEG